MGEGGGGGGEGLPVPLGFGGTPLRAVAEGHEEGREEGGMYMDM